MLQQTRVETVTDYYRRFLKALPDIESLADAPEDLCLKLWEGLGYYSRIRNMQRAARIVMESHDGCLPDTREELEKLPGIGEYTAAAIASTLPSSRSATYLTTLIPVFSTVPPPSMK